MATKKLFYKFGTTGLNPNIHGVHELSYIIEIDDKVTIEKTHFFRPSNECEITDKALTLCGVKKSSILIRDRLESQVCKEFIDDLNSEINKFDKNDKFFLIGFGNATFDDMFLNKFLDRNGYFSDFGSLFYPVSIDLKILLGKKLIDNSKMLNQINRFTFSAFYTLFLGVEFDDKSSFDTRKYLSSLKKLYDYYNLVY